MSLLSSRRVRIASIVPLLLATLSLAQAQSRQRPRTTQPAAKLVEEVTKDFARWDTNKNGVLEEAEIDAVVLDVKVKGDEAAAAAALHNYVFQEHNANRPIRVDKKWLTSSPAMLTMGGRIRDVNVDNVTPQGAPSPRSPDSKSAAPTTQPAGANPVIDLAKTVVTTRPADRRPATRPIISPQAFFDGARRAIARADRHLYIGADGPAFEKIHQGGLGDCYLISVLGAQTYFHPDTMKSMISERDDDAYLVRWGDGTSTEVPGFSDGEIATGGAYTAGGIWVRVMEKALAWRKLPEDKRDDTVSGSAIGKGGSTKTITMLVTGHHADAMRLFAGKTPTPGNVETALKTLRPSLVKALNDKRLVTLGTLPAPLPPPGMSPKHAYAVLKYDEKNDLITIWNPHANTYAAKAPEGIANGYNTRGGIFTMPLADMAKVFGSIAWETGDALKPGELRLSPGPATRPSKKT